MRKPTNPRRWVRSAAAAACILGVLGLAAPADGVSRPSGNKVGTYAAARVRQWLHCDGRGPATVIVVPGLGSTARDWTKVQRSFFATTRACFYDRPGLGNSPARANKTQVLNASIYAKELWALLGAAHEPGPYIVVGHSYGGLIARTFIHQHLSSVAGVLLAESVDPGDRTTGTYWVEAHHRIDMPASQRATGGGPSLGARPLVVLSASRPDEDHLGGPTYGQPAWMTKQWIAEQKANARLSSDSIQVIAKSGHVLQQDNPAATVKALTALVHGVSTHKHLTCSGSWTAVKSTCRW